MPPERFSFVRSSFDVWLTVVKAPDGGLRSLAKANCAPIRLKSPQFWAGKRPANAVSGHKFGQHFLLTEWEQVVDAWQLANWEAYRDVGAASCAATTETPPRPSGRRGRIPKRAQAPGTDTVPLPFADKRQSFLDNVMAGLGQIGAWDDPATSTPAISAQNRATQFGLTPS